MKSMTGYGRGTAALGERQLLCEMRTYNHRFLELKLRLPWTDPVVETNLRQLIRSYIDRGVVWLTVEEAGESPSDVKIDWDRARAYVHAFAELKRALSLEAPISLDLLVSQPGVLLSKQTVEGGQALWDALAPGIETALKDLVESRRREGEKLKADLSMRVATVRKLASGIDERTRETPEQMKKRLRERLDKVLQPGEVDDHRLNQEIALLADRIDTTEELTRLSGHLVELERLFGEATPSGRKIDFLIQELNREINTIGSKAQSSQVAALVVDAKAEIERLREQCQNVE